MIRTNANCTLSSALVLCAAVLASPLAASAVPISVPTVPVGNVGNANDPLTGNLYGGVNHDYRIGTTEVTNAQYTAFLNEKAKSDPLALYDTFMDRDPRAGITRSGVSDSYTYTTKPNMDNKPVNWVSWFDSVRFVNWLQNGQGSGDTETGAYTLLGGTPTPSNANSITRNAGAIWFLPTETEWYKAAYHQPAAQGGDSDNYWWFPTASNTTPKFATINSVGDISNPGKNVANVEYGARLGDIWGNVTTVGSAGPLSNSFYGTADQGGNVLEWNETLVDGVLRNYRGGSYDSNASYLMSSSVRESDDPAHSNQNLGFRVASVPEPSTLALAALGSVVLLAISRRRR